MLMHRNVSDEELGAYLDGAVDAEKRAEIESELAENASLRAQLARVRRVNAAVRDALGELELSPDRFTRIVNEGFDRREPVNVIGLSGRLKSVNWTMAIAASLSLFVTTVGGYWIGSTTRQGGELAVISERTPLFAALESTASGQAVPVDGQTLTPVLSFNAADGRVCREVELASHDGQSAAILCRDRDAWRVEVLVATAPAATPGGYETVGESGVAIEQAYARLGGVGVMSAEEERLMIEKGWRP